MRRSNINCKLWTYKNFALYLQERIKKINIFLNFGVQPISCFNKFQNYQFLLVSIGININSSVLNGYLIRFTRKKDITMALGFRVFAFRYRIFWLTHLLVFKKSLNRTRFIKPNMCDLILTIDKCWSIRFCQSVWNIFKYSSKTYIPYKILSRILDSNGATEAKQILSKHILQ